MNDVFKKLMTSYKMFGELRERFFILWKILNCIIFAQSLVVIAVVKTSFSCSFLSFKIFPQTNVSTEGNVHTITFAATDKSYNMVE